MIRANLRAMNLFQLVELDNPLGGKNSYVPPYALLQADELIDLLNVIIMQYEDLLSNESNFESEIEGIKFPTYKCTLKQIWHIGSLVIYARQLNGILKCVYEKHKKWTLKLYPGHVFSPTEENDKAGKLLKLYRDKVFAHASYFAPKDDPPEIVYGSLHVLLASRTYPSLDGRISVRLEGHEHLNMENVIAITQKVVDKWTKSIQEINDFISSKSSEEISLKTGLSLIDARNPARTYIVKKQ